MKKKIIISLFLLLILVANFSFANYSTVTMSVVKEPVCTIDLTDKSKFEKKLIAKDLANKEVTLQLQVINGEEKAKLTGELMLVIDNSESMKELSSDESNTRKDVMYNSIQTFTQNLLTDNNDLKIGAVSFSTNVEQSKEGTSEDAQLVSSLTSDVSVLKSSISKIEANGPRTNLESGITLASKQFTSEKNNKYMIIFTDGVPNVAIDYDKTYYSDDVINKTKTALENTSKTGVQIITLLTGISNGSENPTGRDDITFDGIIEKVFGTEAKPTAGKFYYIQDNEIEKTILTNIYNDLVPTEKSLKDITIVDYFPEEIVKNFEFAYVSEANIGDISAKVDTSTNSITWTIPELKSGQTATVQYKLKLKEDFDSSIVDKILNTNQKVDIDYKDPDGAKQTKTSDVSPQIKLTEPPAVIPKAGLTTLIIFIIIAGGLAIYSFTKLAILKNKTK